MPAYLSIGLVSLWFSRWGTAPTGFFLVRALLFVVLVLALGTNASAQYAFTEGGIHLRGGAILPYGSPRWQAGPSLAIGGFYTHYFCGKRSGYWLEASLQQHFFQETASTSPSILRDGATAENQFSLLNLQVAALYKFRAVNYHRPREWALLIGPKLDLAFNSRAAAGAEGYTALSDSSTRTVQLLWLGAHAAILRRWPIGGKGKNAKRSILAMAGVDYYPLALAERGPVRLQAVVLTFGVGLTVWDNR